MYFPVIRHADRLGLRPQEWQSLRVQMDVVLIGANLVDAVLPLLNEDLDALHTVDDLDPFQGFQAAWM